MGCPPQLGVDPTRSRGEAGFSGRGAVTALRPYNAREASVRLLPSPRESGWSVAAALEGRQIGRLRQTTGVPLHIEGRNGDASLRVLLREVPQGVLGHHVHQRPREDAGGVPDVWWPCPAPAPGTGLHAD